MNNKNLLEIHVLDALYVSEDLNCILLSARTRAL